MKKTALIAALLLAGLPALAQNRTRFAGMANAFDYAFGVNSSVPPLMIDSGPIASGTQTVTVAFGSVTAGDGTVFAPLSTTTAIQVGAGADIETVTPSAVSCSTPQSYDTCTFTATFSNAHGRGEPVASATYGLGEAVNYMHANGGGLVVIAPNFISAGGSTSTVTAQKGWINVSILQAIGTASGSAYSYKAASNGSNYAATTVSWY